MPNCGQQGSEAILGAGGLCALDRQYLCRELRGAGGPPALRMDRDGDSGAWVATLDTTLVPNGSQPLEVITDDNRALYPRHAAHLERSDSAVRPS
jgi:hypothetical protein